MLFFLRPQHNTAVSRRPCCGLEKKGMVGAWHGHGMTSVNQTRPHCVSQMGKTHSKPLAALHGRGTAWARHGNVMLCVNRPEGSECSAARPGRTLSLGKTRYPFYRRLGGPQGRSGRAENLAPLRFDLRTVQPVVSRCTD